MFLQQERNRFILNLLNCQQELPNLPIHDLRLRVNVQKSTPWAVSILPTHEPLEFSRKATLSSSFFLASRILR